jgi:O-antigen/teichoic acid export membrane protein
MSGWVKSLWKDSIVYGIGYGVSRFLQIIILPIITQALTLSEFGYYSNYVIFYTFCAGFFVLGLDNAVARFFYDTEDDKYHQRIFSTSFFFILLVSALCVTASYFFSPEFVHLLGVPEQYGNAFLYVLICIPVVAINNFFLSWFKWKRQKFYFLINSGGTIALLLIPLILAKDISFLFIFRVLFFSQFIVAIVSCFFARDYIRPYFNTKLLASLLAYGFPWLLVFLFGLSRTYLDRVFLTKYLRDDVYGMYNFSVRVSTLIALVITAFEMSFGPLAFSIWNKEGARQFFARLQSVYVFFISVVACAICVISPVVVQLLGGAKYHGSETILPLLLFAAIPVSLINFSNLGTVYAKKSFLSTLSLFIGFAAVLILNFVLTHIYLQYGAALSSMIGHILIIISGYIFSKKYYHIPFSYAKDAFIYLFFFVLSMISVNYSLSDTIYLNILYQSVILAVLIFLFIIFIFPEEIRKTLSAVRGMLYRG